MRIFYLLSILFLSCTLFGQKTIKGIVVDQKGESLPFVNILVNDSPKDGVSTDIDGRFEITNEADITSLTLSYVGYEQLRILAPFANPLRIQLQATAYNIETIEIIAGENPAHRIIKKAVANIPLNDHEQMAAYECLTYNKMTMGFEPNTAALDSFYAKKDLSKKRIKNLSLIHI